MSSFLLSWELISIEHLYISQYTDGECVEEFPSVMLNLVCPFGGTAGHLGCQ